MPKQVMTGFLEFFVPSIYSFKNGPSSASFWFIFGLFKQTIQNLQQINVKNVHPPLTTRPLFSFSSAI